MSKVLFSHSYYYKLDSKQWNTGMPYPPLGTIFAASYLRENGFDVSLFDVCLRGGPQDIEDIIKLEKPDYLVLYDDGFNYLTKMCLTNMREAAFKMISIAKKYNCKAVVSSSDSTDQFQNYLAHKADVILLGEGELSLLETLKCIDDKEDLKQVKGICYIDESEEILNTGRRSVIKDLDILPQPAWDLIDIDSYTNY